MPSLVTVEQQSTGKFKLQYNEYMFGFDVISDVFMRFDCFVEWIID